MNNSLLTVNELSSYLHIHPNTVYKRVESGSIPFIRREGLGLRFRLKDIEAWLGESILNPLISPDSFPSIDISLDKYDKLMLKGVSALSKNSKRWNYGIGAVYVRKTKQGKDRWYIDYCDSGNRVRQVVRNAKSRAEAVLVLREKVTAAFNKVHAPDLMKKKTAFQDLAELYINDYAKANKRSWRDDEYRIEAHMNPYFGTFQLDAITPLMIEKYRAMRLEAGVTKSTVNREITIMKKMFNLAVDWRLASSNPVVKVKLFSERNTQKERILSAEEEDKLFKESPEYLKPILTVALNTGMRRGEILSLKWNQVDLSRRIIKVRQTKSGKNRIIPINDALYFALSELQRDENSSALVFPSPKTGLPYTEIKKSFKSACKRAGIADLRFHDLRHTFATRLLEVGVDIITVRDLLGHFSVRITQRYTHSNQSQKEKAVLALMKTGEKQARNEEDLAHICHISPQGNLSKSRNALFSVN